MDGLDGKLEIREDEYFKAYIVIFKGVGRYLAGLGASHVDLELQFDSSLGCCMGFGWFGLDGSRSGYVGLDAGREGEHGASAALTNRYLP